MVHRTLLALLLLGVATCGGDDGTGTDTSTIQVNLVSGSNQSGRVGEELPDPVVVRVTRNSQDVPGHLVNFHVTRGGGSVFAGAALTDALGMAQDFWTLGPDAGENVLEVRSVNPTTGEKEVFGTFTATGIGVLMIQTMSLPIGAMGASYDATLAASGGDGAHTWSLATGSLPAGLGLAASGAVTGTPTVIGVSEFTVRVASGDGQADQRELTVTVGLEYFCRTQPGSAIVTFEDARLELGIWISRSAEPQEPLTCGMVGAMTRAAANFMGVISLLGIENLRSLTRLELAGNGFTDLSPLGGLTSLSTLLLNNNGRFSDISPLSELTSLATLGLQNNSISDISALGGLTGLTELRLDNNPALNNIQPLLDNTGLGAGDEIDLRSTNVSCEDLAALEAKGVTVVSDCP